MPNRYSHRTVALGGMLAVGAVLVAGCSRTGYLAEPDPAVDASWVVSSIEVDGQAVDLRSGLIIVDIDTSIDAVEIATGCRTLLGSFTFLDDGRAGFTLPGGTKDRCDTDTESWLLELDETFAGTIGAVTNWTGGNDEPLILTGPASEIVLEQPT